MTTTSAKSGARAFRPHGANVTSAPTVPIVLFVKGPGLKSACPGHKHRARSCAMAAVAGRLGAAVASTIRVAHLAMAAEAMWKSATEGGGVTLDWKTAQGGPYEGGGSNIQICL